MDPIDFRAIEREARRLRAEEMRRIEGIVIERTAYHLRQLGAGLPALGKALGEALRPLLSSASHGRKVRSS